MGPRSPLTYPVSCKWARESQLATLSPAKSMMETFSLLLPSTTGLSRLAVCSWMWTDQCVCLSTHRPSLQLPVSAFRQFCPNLQLRVIHHLACLSVRLYANNCCWCCGVQLAVLS